MNFFESIISLFTNLFFRRIKEHLFSQPSIYKFLCNINDSIGPACTKIEDFKEHLKNIDNVSWEHLVAYWAQTEEPVKKGDVNGDTAIDVADISSIISVMAAGSNNPSADVNKDGAVDVADISSVISIMAGGE